VAQDVHQRHLVNAVQGQADHLRKTLPIRSQVEVNGQFRVRLLELLGVRLMAFANPKGVKTDGRSSLLIERNVFTTSCKSF
jgi:hypothetical protein